MTKMRLLLVNGLLATALFAAGAFGVPACASSGKKTSPPATTSGAPPAVSPPAPSAPPPAAPPAATPPSGEPPAAAPSPPSETSAMPPAGDAAGGRGGRGTPPPPPPPPPAVMPPPVAPIVSATAPAPDPRVGLKAGRWDAAQAAWNMRMLSTTPPTGKVLGATHSDLAFSGNLVVMGNYNGFEIFDISNPSKPVLMQTYLCPASQNDVSVYRNLLFMSSEAINSRADCGFEGVPEPVSKLRVRGIRVFDISDVKRPKLVTTVQTCRGSHTHTVVTKQGDDANVFIYVSGTAAVRSAEEVQGCTDGGIDDPNTARFRLDAAADANMSFWHSATFNNDGTKLLFTDEWGGGGQPRCRVTDKPEWGADALFTIENQKLKFHSYYKLPAPQTPEENCVAHNGSLIPIPGRDIMVQSWYQGGVSVFDWTDIDHPKEIAYFDRGPVDATRMLVGGTWSAYWYNGVIVSSEIARGLDVYELVVSGLITENELAAAKTVKVAYWNTQDQQKFVWAPSFVVARAFLDQLARSSGMAAESIAAARTALENAEKRSGAQRKTALTELAAKVSGDSSVRDQAKVKMLSAELTELASAQR